MEAQAAYDSMMSETQPIIDSFMNDPVFRDATTTRQTELLDDYEQNQWNPYAQERWGSDLVTANKYKNSIFQPLRDHVRKREAEIDTWDNTAYNLFQSVALGGDRLVDEFYSLLAAPDIYQDQYYGSKIKNLGEQYKDLEFKKQLFIDPVEYENERSRIFTELEAVKQDYLANKPELQESLSRVADEVAKSQANEKARREANPQRMQDYVRKQEIRQQLDREGNKDGWVLWREIAENPRVLANLLLEQAPSMLPTLAAGAVAGPVGATTVGAISGVAETTSAIADEIFNAPIEDLSKLPEYRELAEQGYSDRDIRIQMVAKAVAEVSPEAALITGATSLFGPETLLARTSVVQNMVKGGLGKRMVAAGAIGAPSEALEEGTQQNLQNIGWNVATGDTRDITEGQGEAMFAGALLGGIMGAAGGIRDSQTPSSETKSPEGSTDTETPSDGGTPTSDQNVAKTEAEETFKLDGITSGGINIPDVTRVPQAASGAVNTKYNKDTVFDTSLVTATLSDIDTDLERISKLDSPIYTEFDNVFTGLSQAESWGANSDIVDSVLSRVQLELNRNPNVTVKAADLYKQWKLKSGVYDVNQQRSDTGGTATGGETAAPATEVDQSVVAAGTATTGGTDGTVEVSGIGGTTYPVTSTSAGDVQVNQSVGRTSGERANSGRDNRTDGPDDEGPDSGNGGGAATTEQRTGDAGRTAESGGTPAGGVNTPSREQFASEFAGIRKQHNKAKDSVSAAKLVADFLKRYNYTPTNTHIYTDEDVLALSILNLESNMGKKTSNKVIANYLNKYATGRSRVSTEQVKQVRKLSEAEKKKIRSREFIHNLPDIDNETRAIYYDVLTDDGTLTTVIDNLYKRLGNVAQSLSQGGGSSSAVAQVSTNTISPDADNAQVAAYLEQELINNGRTPEMAKRETVILLRLLNTLGSVSGLTPAQQLQRLRFGIGVNTNKVVNRLLQEGWHGSPYDFDEFTTDHIGMGDGGHLHGWGLYFALTREIAERHYKPEGGRLYRAIIPDDDVLLGEYKSISEQPDKVKQAISDIIKDFKQELDNTTTRGEKFKLESLLERLQREGIGKDFYDALAVYFGDDKAASELLNRYGIQGIRYDGGRDGPCVVVFNSEAIQILETLQQTNERGRIDFLNDGTMNILFGENADASTAIHEFQHMFVMEALLILNDSNTPASYAKTQLLSDIKTLAKFAGIKPDSATDFNAWTDKAHEKVAKAFELYFRNGVAPSPELDGLFAKMRELLTQIYQRAKLLLNRSLPAEVQRVFDRQLTGYDSGTNESIDVAKIPDTEVYLDEFLANTDTTIQGQENSIEDTSANNAADVALTAINNPDSITAQAAYEAAQDPMDMTSPLATHSATDEDTLTELANGQLPPVVKAAVESDNSALADTVSMVVRGPEEGGDTDTQPTPEQEAVIKENLITQLNEGLAEGGVSAEGQEIENSDGTHTVGPGSEPPTPELELAASQIQDMENKASLARGLEFVRNTVSAFADTTFAPIWQAGRWAKMCTLIRKSMVDGGAHFYTWCLERFSNAKGDPMNNPLWRSFSTLSNRIFGASKIFVDNVLHPLHTWAEEIASKYNIDPQVLLHNVGLYRTCLHTIEAAYKREIELQEDLQRALVMPAGKDKGDAVTAAQKALDEFYARQEGKQNDVALYGGRSVAEAQEEIDRILSEIDALTDGNGQALLDEGNTQLHMGLRWITRWLMENGQLSTEDVSRFDEWNHYTPLTVDYKRNDVTNNDIFYYAPRQNFHRGGSKSAAQDGYKALVQYGCRAARTVGMSEFGYTLYQAYEYLKSIKLPTGKLHGVVFYQGLGLMPTNYLNGILNNSIPADESTRAWAAAAAKDATSVIRIVETDENTGESVTKSYYVMFAKKDESGEIVIDNDTAAAMRNPFREADPDKLLSTLANATSKYAWLYTRFRPYFPVLTGVRDTIERASLLPAHTFVNDKGQEVHGIKIAAQMVGFLANPINYYRIAKYWISGSSGSQYIDQQLDDFFNSGTDMSGNYNKMLSELRKKSAADIRDNIPDVIKSRGAKAVNTVVGTITKWGDFFYSLPAFAQFIKMRENGISLQQTVSGTVGLMNMQQRGTFSGRYLAPFFPFVNSIGQTAGNMLYALGLHTAMFGNHPNKIRLYKSAIKGWATIFGAYATVRMLMPLIAESLSDDEEEGQQRLDMIPLGQVSTFIPVGDGAGNYYKWPTGFGLFQMGSMFAYGLDRVERGKMSAGDFMATAMTTFAKALVPNSMPAFEFNKDPVAFVMQSLSPMLLQPLTQVATNRTWAGGQITYDSFNRTLRRSDTGSFTTRPVWKDWAQSLYDVSDGVLDMTPEEIKTIVSGYLGGVAQGLVAAIEADPLYSHPMYQSTRDKLGPFWTAMGATSLYSAALNLDRTAYYTAREHYEGMIKDAGIGKLLKGSEVNKRDVMRSAGFLETEIDDYLLLYKTERELSDLTTETKKEMDKLLGPNMDETAIRQRFAEWGDRQQMIFNDLRPRLNFYTPGFRRRWGAPDTASSEALRNQR